MVLIPVVAFPNFPFLRHLMYAFTEHETNEYSVHVEVD